ncbi:aldolase/citrate lyase family protein [Bifidobacterium pullorum]|uniref:aldolase/citrate lyase family protein n=1 Tax=Bifidobacterium pullorum TaxID=78448 RepID=UPI001958857F|nr:aldolase/citrate lyase family protein [Bifidobacterium pullorum]
MASVALPRNEFKAAIKEGRQLKGLWLAMGSATSAEIAAEVGYDWLLIDGEHGPNDLTTILGRTT